MIKRLTGWDAFRIGYETGRRVRDLSTDDGWLDVLTRPLSVTLRDAAGCYHSVSGFLEAANCEVEEEEPRLVTGDLEFSLSKRVPNISHSLTIRRLGEHVLNLDLSVGADTIYASLSETFALLNKEREK